MKICSICKKISGTDQDHLNCQEMRRIELEAQDLKDELPEKITIAKNDNELNSDIKALLKHMKGEKD